jgi:hypothetical protein
MSHPGKFGRRLNGKGTSAMGTTFSAGPHALGYLYQARVALYLLLECPDEAIVKIEGLDDIEIAGSSVATPLELTQLKHHINKEAELTDFSSDLWKSIRVWAEQAGGKSFSLRDTRLILITTAKAANGSVAAMLGLKDRNENEAEKRLLEVANTSKNEKLQKAFTAYKDLDGAMRTALVTSITILDQHPNIDEYKSKIRQKIRPAVRLQHLDSLYERLEGWWFNKTVQHLLGMASTPFISAFELNEKIASIAETFHHENLPIDFVDAIPDAAFAAECENKLFVKQLEALNLRQRAVGKAIHDYYRAYEQRSRWLEDGLIFADELVKYEERLKDEWERYLDAQLDNLVEQNDEDELLRCGRKILQWAEQEAHTLRLRPRVEADFVRRGSFHILANKSPAPPIYWHPKFEEMLESVLASVAK